MGTCRKIFLHFIGDPRCHMKLYLNCFIFLEIVWKLWLRKKGGYAKIMGFDGFIRE